MKWKIAYQDISSRRKNLWDNDGNFEIIQSEENKVKKNSESLHDVRIQSEEKKMQIIGIPEGERSTKLIKEIIAENLRTGEFPKSEEKFGNSLVKLRDRLQDMP